MKAAAKADAPEAEPEPVPQYDALLAEEVPLRLWCRLPRRRIVQLCHVCSAEPLTLMWSVRGQLPFSASET